MSAVGRDDAELLRDWRNGDAMAGRALFEKHAPLVTRFFSRRAGADAEDLVQATFEACVLGRDHIVSEARFRGYVLAIARRKLYAYLAARQRAHDAGAGHAEDPEILPSSMTSPSAGAARNERNDHVHAVLRGLPLELQLVVELHYWENLTMVEIADVVGVPVGTVKTRIRRARELLATAIDLPEPDRDR